MKVLFEQEVLTPVEAAARLGVTRATVFQWMRRGSIRAYKMGGRYYIPQTAMAALLKDVN
jgi:excisionase family DNA binding protein